MNAIRWRWNENWRQKGRTLKRSRLARVRRYFGSIAMDLDALSERWRIEKNNLRLLHVHIVEEARVTNDPLLCQSMIKTDFMRVEYPIEILDCSQWDFVSIFSLSLILFGPHAHPNRSNTTSPSRITSERMFCDRFNRSRSALAF